MKAAKRVEKKAVRTAQRKDEMRVESMDARKVAEMVVKKGQRSVE